MTKSEWFTREELQCKCGCGRCEMVGELMILLDQVRNCVGEPVILTSAYRCTKHNEEIGGVLNSAHCSGKAVDIYTKDAKSRFELLRILFTRNDVVRVGIADEFIHVDIDKTKQPYVTWLY